MQAEVAKQVPAFSERFDELEDRIEALAETLQAREDGAAKKARASLPPKKAPAKKAAAKKARQEGRRRRHRAKKAAAKKAPAKKAAAKKAPRQEGRRRRRQEGTASRVGSSGVRKVSTARKA